MIYNICRSPFEVDRFPSSDVVISEITDLSSLFRRILFLFSFRVTINSSPGRIQSKREKVSQRSLIYGRCQTVE